MLRYSTSEMSVDPGYQMVQSKLPIKNSKLFYMYVLKTKLTVESTSVTDVQPWLKCWSAHIVRKCTTMTKITMNIWVYMTVLRDSNVENVMTNFSLTRKCWYTENSIAQRNKCCTYMSHFSYSCKTEQENGISCLISKLGIPWAPP